MYPHDQTPPPTMVLVVEQSGWCVTASSRCCLRFSSAVWMETGRPLLFLVSVVVVIEMGVCVCYSVVVVDVRVDGMRVCAGVFVVYNCVVYNS